MILASIDEIHDNGHYLQKDKIKALIFHKIASQKTTTRKMIINDLRLRPTSVSTALGELFQDGIIMEEKKPYQDSRQGRPEAYLSAQKNRFVAAAIHFESRSLIVTLLNSFEEVISRKRVDISENDDNTAFKGKFTAIMQDILSAVPVKSSFVGIGISLIGFIDLQENAWIFAARWPLIRKLKFSELSISSRTPVMIRRALDCELEYLIASRQELRDRDVLLIHWGYGIGASFAEHGRVISTNIGGFCEVGHWQGFTQHGSRCSCGSIGCLEASAALWGLIPKLKQHFSDAPEEENEFYDYVKQNEAILDHPEIETAIENMAKSITHLYTVFFPERVFIYGPFSENNRIFTALKNKITQLIPFFSRKYFSLDRLETNYRGQIVASVKGLFLDGYRKVLKAH